MSRLREVRPCGAPCQPHAGTRADEVEAALVAAASMHRSPRMYDDTDTDAETGSVHWKPSKSLWIGGMTVVAIVAGPATATPGAILLFLVSTAITICLGHSLGMHRRLIHRAFDCPLWLERLFVYFGTLVGMAGPFGMIRQHEIRDWAQRRPQCHPYLAHRSSLVRDGWWQMHCELRLAHPPELVVEQRVVADRFYRVLEQTWMAHQLPWAVLFFAVGGWPWVVWGIAVRVALSLTGHWLVGYFAHKRGPRNWHVEGAGVQGYNVPWVSLLTMGESLHNNHHAYPASARLAHKPGETDPGWWVLLALARAGFVTRVQTPQTLPARPNLVPLDRGDRPSATNDVRSNVTVPS